MLFSTAIAQQFTPDEHVSQMDIPHAYASDAHSCGRQVNLRCIIPRGSKEAHEHLESLLVYDIGNYWHAKIQNAFKLHNSSFTPEVYWQTELMTGRADGTYVSTLDSWVEIPDSNVQVSRAAGLHVCLEVKTMNSRKFAKALKAPFPFFEHFVQACLSAINLGCTVIHILYINRNVDFWMPPIIQWILPVDELAAELEIMRLANDVKLAAKGIISEPFYQGEVIENPGFEKFPCGYCQYSSLCKKLGPRQRQLSKDTIAKLNDQRKV